MYRSSYIQYKALIEPVRQPDVPFAAWQQPIQLPPIAQKVVIAVICAGAFMVPNTAAEAVSIDRWHQNTNKPQFDVVRQQHVYPSFFYHPEPKEVTELVSTDFLFQEPSWIADFVRINHRFPTTPTIDPTILLTPENPQIDKWFKESELPRWDIQRTAHLVNGNFNIFIRNFSAVFPVGGAHVVFETLHQYQSKFEALQEIITPEDITLDKWYREAARPRWDVTRQQYVYPYKFFIERPIETNNILATAPRFIGPTHIFDRKRTQYTYPSSFFDPEPISLEETITADSWYFEQAIAWDRPRTQYLYPFISAAPVRANPILTDQWFRETERPRRDRAREQYKTATWFNFDPLPIPPPPHIGLVHMRSFQQAYPLTLEGQPNRLDSNQQSRPITLDTSGIPTLDSTEQSRPVPMDQSEIL